MAKEVVETITANQVTVIAGDTGCGKNILYGHVTSLSFLTLVPGKTTQIPQIVLDDKILKGQGAETNIIVTQPRRISAIGVSERIAKERTEKVGETCGYSIKLEKKMSSTTRLLLCTTGVLLRRLQCDPDLALVSHIFVDEVRNIRQGIGYFELKPVNLQFCYIGPRARSEYGLFDYNPQGST